MAYKALADVYDLLMDEIDYLRWAAYVDEQLRKYGCPGKRLLDLGCGTGNITIPLAQLGYQITAVDLSAEMLAQAARKSRALGLDIDWQQQDMTDLLLEDADGVPLQFDAVIATFDAFNYITDPEQLQHLLQSLDLLLADGGILLFDVQTPYQLRTYLGDNIFTLHRPEVEYVWENHFDDETQLCEMEITFFIQQANGLYQRAVEHHVERVYELELLKLWLQLYGFAVLTVQAALSEQPLRPESPRAVFVARHLSLEDQEQAFESWPIDAEMNLE